MIIKISNADFSSDYIEKVNVKKKLDAFTIAAIEASGNSSLTTEQKFALDDFFGTLGAYGDSSNIWSKMSYMFIPFLSSDVSKAMVNYVGNDTSIVPDSSKFELRNKGLAVKESQTGYFQINHTSSFDGEDISYGFRYMESFEATSTKGYMLCQFGSLNPGRFITKVNVPSALNTANISLVKDGGTNVYATPYARGSIIQPAAVVISVYGSESSNLQLFTSNETSPKIGTAVMPTLNNRLYVLNGFNDYADSNYPSLGIFFVGSHLTQEELVTVVNAIDSLVAYF